MSGKNQKAAGSFIILVLCAFSTLASSCSNDASSYYPSGIASVVSHYESQDSTAKICVMTVKVLNNGASKISTSIISVSATTTSATYRLTKNFTLDILPGKSAYFDLTVAYASATESLATDGASVIDSYFE